MAAFRANAAAMTSRAAGKPIRLASKSVRCRHLIAHALGLDGFRGILAYTLPEALWLTAQLAKSLGTQWIDIAPRRGPGDNILLSKDRNPNINGARLILASTSEPGARLMAIADAVKSGQIKAVAVLGENPMHLGIPVEQLAQVAVFIVMDILENEATERATVVLPASGFAEKRGSMINGKGRLQRLNRAVRPPGNARDDWEILRDLLQAIGGGDSLHSVDEVFRKISDSVLQFAGLTLSKIGDFGVHILQIEELPPMHPKDEEAIEQAIAVQAARRAARRQPFEARKPASAETH